MEASSTRTANRLGRGSQPRDVARRRRFWLLAGAWAMVVVTTAISYPHALKYAWFFPYGLVLGARWVLGTRGASQTPPYLLVWSVYLGLTLGGLLIRRRAFFFALYGLLCALLLLNLAGCQKVLHDLRP